MNRKQFLDHLRIAATCAVVLLHTVTGVMDTTDMSLYPLEKTVFLVALDLITWCVPVFVLISGYLFLNPQKEISFQRMLTKYCRRIFFALILFGVPYAGIELVVAQRSFRWSMVGEAAWMVCKGESWSHMWYLYMILLLYFFTPFIKWVVARIPRWGLYLLMGFLLVGSSILPFLKKLLEWEFLAVLPDGGIYLFYYLCGYLFACADNQRKSGKAIQNSWKKKVVVTVLLSLFAGMVCSRLFGDYRVQMAYNYPFTVLVALLMMWIAQTSKRQGGDWWKRVSELSFTIYLIHPVLLNVCYKFLHITLLDFPIWLSLPGIFMTVLVLSVIIAWVLYQIPLLRKWVL